MLLKRILILASFGVIILFFGFILFFKFYTPQLSESHGKVDAALFVGESENQPLIVAFGGSQGGNTWAEEFWSEMRNRFLRDGYAVLSIGYFKTKSTPETLDRISLDAIHDTIMRVSNHPKIDKNRIALLGSSRGGELVLNLASRYAVFNAVVALVPPHVTFPSLTPTANTSAWTFMGEEISHVKMPYKAIGLAIRGESLRVAEAIFENESKENETIIQVERINGPVLLVSARDDAIWPSKYMCDRIVRRLHDNNFKYYYEHYSFDGGHHDTKKHFKKIFEFLDHHFKHRRDSVRN